MNLYSDYESLEELVSSLAVGHGQGHGNFAQIHLSSSRFAADNAEEDIKMSSLHPGGGGGCSGERASSIENTALADIAKALSVHVEAAARELSLAAFASFESSLLQVHKRNLYQSKPIFFTFF